MKLSLRDQMKAASVEELESMFDLYNSLQSRGVKDEFILTLLEQELAQRELAELNEEHEVEYYH